MATRKRQPAAAPPQPVSVDALAAFIGDEQADPARLQQALALATDAAQASTGKAVGDTAPHAIRHGVFLLASHLLITDQLEEPPAEIDIPLVVRAFWRQADAQLQPH